MQQQQRTKQATGRSEMLTGRQILCVIYHSFKVGDTETRALDLVDLMSVKLINDNLRAFDTRWDKIILGMVNQQDEEMLESLYNREVKKSPQFHQTYILYEQDVTHRGEPRSYYRLKAMVIKHLETKTADAHLANRDQRESGNWSRVPNISMGLVAQNAWGNQYAGGPSTPRKSGECHQWVFMGSCSRLPNCPYDHIQSRKGAGKGQRQRKRKRKER